MAAFICRHIHNARVRPKVSAPGRPLITFNDISISFNLNEVVDEAGVGF